ncbi:MAG: NAD-dependent epimerase/dehydratase family protein [Gammaproteobacteria bacterium]|nr:NAD-dependent epimerase/dehydratase family protein [Gammaproteobacteria bacterium]
MTTLVTGGTGFVGSAVVRELLAHGHEVRVLVRPGSDRRNLAGLDVAIAEGDLREPATVRRAVQGCRALFHVAADYRLWSPRPADLYESNVEGSRQLLLAAADAGVARVVYTSSVATLGINPDRSPANEDTPVCLADMIGHYKRSKFLAEQAVRELVVTTGLAVVIVNPSTPVGPRDIKPTPTGRTILDAARGRMPAYVDTGLNVVHVDDVARGHRLAFERGEVGARYVLGGEDMTLRSILTAVARLAGRQPPTVRLPHNVVLPIAALSELWARVAGAGEPRATVAGVRMARKHMYFSSAKARAALGYEHRPAQEALQDAVAWFERNFP